MSPGSLLLALFFLPRTTFEYLDNPVTRFLLVTAIVCVVVNTAIKFIFALLPQKPTPFGYFSQFNNVADDNSGLDDNKDHSTSHSYNSYQDFGRAAAFHLGFLARITVDVTNNFIFKVAYFTYACFFFVGSHELKDFNKYRRLLKKKTSVHQDHSNSRIERGTYLSKPSTESIISEKTIVFIRHGESVWNYVFNRGFDPSFALRLIILSLLELFMFCEKDSVILDSPLSTDGISQATTLRRWLGQSVSLASNTESGANNSDQSEAEEVKNYVRNLLAGGAEDEASVEESKALDSDDTSSTVIVTSNLRRAISTSLIALSGRLKQRPAERVYVLPFLQEATRNADGISLSPAFEPPPVSQFEKAELPFNMSQLYASKLDQSYNSGSKNILTASLLSRLQGFNDWVFSNSERVHTVVACGHSLWLRNYFFLYLPHEIPHPAKEKKLSNCGIARFKLIKYRTDTNKIDYWIDPNSVVAVHGEFGR